MAYTRRVVAAVIITLIVMICRGAAAADTPSPADAVEKRVALVVGIGDYKSAPKLANPPNDARLIATRLKASGFKLVGDGAQVDLDRDGFASALNEFSAIAAGADVALFFYAGHGMQLLDTNWLLPISANPEKPTDLAYQAIDMNDVLTRLDRSEAKFKLVLLDACRNNPFVGRGLRGASGTGLMRMEAPDGTLISYSTKPGHVAQDGTGADSPYTTQLATIMAQPDVPVLSMFNQLGVAVKRATDGTQEPWLAASPIEKEFMFLPGSRATAGAGAAGGTQLAMLTPSDQVIDPGKSTSNDGLARDSDPTASRPDARIFEWIDQKRSVPRDVDVFDAPASGSSTIASLRKGAEPFVVGLVVGGEWLQIRMPDNGPVGYVMADRLPEIADASSPPSTGGPTLPKLTYLDPPPPPPPISGRPIVHDSATLLIDDHVVPLSGVEGFGGEPSAGLQKFLTAKGDFVTCQPADPGRYTCLTRDGTDVAKAALLNGAAKGAPGAANKYADQQVQAHTNARGIWAPAAPPPPRPDPLPPDAVYAAGAPAPDYLVPSPVSVMVDADQDNYEVAEIDGQPMTVINGERVIVEHDRASGWGYRDAAGAFRPPPPRLDQGLNTFYRSRPLPPPPMAMAAARMPGASPGPGRMAGSLLPGMPGAPMHPGTMAPSAALAMAGRPMPQHANAPLGVNPGSSGALAATRPRPAMAFAAPAPVPGAHGFVQSINRQAAPAAVGGSSAHMFSQGMTQRTTANQSRGTGFLGQLGGSTARVPTGAPRPAPAPAPHACKKAPC